MSFQNAWFTKAIKKAGVCDAELCKESRENIESDELAQFKLLVKSYAALSASDVQRLIDDHYFLEICHDHKNRDSS